MQTRQSRSLRVSLTRERLRLPRDGGCAGAGAPPWAPLGRRGVGCVPMPRACSSACRPSPCVRAWMAGGDACASRGAAQRGHEWAAKESGDGGNSRSPMCPPGKRLGMAASGRWRATIAARHARADTCVEICISGAIVANNRWACVMRSAASPPRGARV